MGLLKKALIYRNSYLNKLDSKKERGLLNRALQYLEDNDGIYNNINSDENNFNIQTQVLEDSYDLSKYYDSENIIDTDLSDEKIELIDEDNKLSRFSNYFDVLNNIADELSQISLKNNPSKRLIKTISNNFRFKKDILLIYNFDKEKFIYWQGNNIDFETINKMKFDLKFNNIYNEIVENKFLYINKNENRDVFSELLSNEDNKHSDFLLFIPFTFSGHIIGIYSVLKLYNNSQPEDDLIQALMTVGRLNGSLLYNIYQQEKLQKLNNHINDTDLKDNFNKNDEFKLNDPLVNFKTFIKNLFDKKISNFSIIQIEFKINNGKLEFELINFYSDIQFIVMNIVGTNSYVEITEDLNIYVILPSINKEYALKTAKKIKEEIKNIFTEVTENFIPELTSKIITYPDDAINLLDILSLL
ncbi:MAG: hypothetical protein JXB50_02095 [Spirochaetes bacterium]|nr:hypothetical protein [Spirochaetota bacterium]